MTRADTIENLRKDILGKKYSLSVAFVDENKSQEINKKYRKKNKPTNVLSFALRENAGELVLCKSVVKKEAKKLGRKESDWLIFLVIHGMLHLKGMQHGSIMEEAEIKYGQKYIGGDRHWLQDDSGRRG